MGHRKVDTIADLSGESKKIYLLDRGIGAVYDKGRTKIYKNDMGRIAKKDKGPTANKIIPTAIDDTQRDRLSSPKSHSGGLTRQNVSKGHKSLSWVEPARKKPKITTEPL